MSDKLTEKDFTISKTFTVIEGRHDFCVHYEVAKKWKLYKYPELVEHLISKKFSKHELVRELMWMANVDG